MKKLAGIIALLSSLLVVIVCGCFLFISLDENSDEQLENYNSSLFNETVVKIAGLMSFAPVLIIDGPIICNNGEQLDSKTKQCRKVL